MERQEVVDMGDLNTEGYALTLGCRIAALIAAREEYREMQPRFLLDMGHRMWSSALAHAQEILAKTEGELYDEHLHDLTATFCQLVGHLVRREET